MNILFILLVLPANTLSSSELFNEIGLQPVKAIYKTIVSTILENCTTHDAIYKSENVNVELAKLALELWHKPNASTNTNGTVAREIFTLKKAQRNLMTSPYYDPSLPIAIFIHGFRSASHCKEPRGVAGVLVARGAVNVLVLDSSEIVAIDYIKSAYYGNFIGNELGELLSYFVKDGLKPNDIHIIGHSLGAQIAGFTGKMFTNLTGTKLARITALDPAGPCFFKENPEHRLSRGDAGFVDVIHTNAGIYGYANPIGDVDFYPNGGEEQPGCPESSCSHERSWRFYMESIVHPNAFLAVQCINKHSFDAGKCNDNAVAYMGYYASFETRGVYYLKTGNSSPYGLGPNGIKVSNRVFQFVENALRTIHT